jgi:thymidylate synthase (FAD)
MLVLSEFIDKAQKNVIRDPYFNLKVLSRTQNPNTIIHAALRQDYSDKQISIHNIEEQASGKAVIKYLLAGGRGHFGPLEHPQITLSVGYFPHSTVQQARTHRVGVSFDVQSFRYTEKSILAAAEDFSLVEQAFYMRPGNRHYQNRSGERYYFSDSYRGDLLEELFHSAKRYAHMRSQGFSEEHCRGLIPFDLRQHFVVSFNLRSALHFLDLMSKADAAPEIITLAEMLAIALDDWVPEIMEWYRSHRMHRAKLAP